MESRQTEIRPILQKLRELHLTIKEHGPLKTLLAQMQIYIKTGARAQIDIPFPAINVTIKGVLCMNKTWVKLAPMVTNVA